LDLFEKLERKYHELRTEFNKDDISSIVVDHSNSNSSSISRSSNNNGININVGDIIISNNMIDSPGGCIMTCLPTQLNININMINNLEEANYDNEVKNILRSPEDIKEFWKLVDIIGTNPNVDPLVDLVVWMFEKIHCQENKPEHHNIYVGDKKNERPIHVLNKNL